MVYLLIYYDPGDISLVAFSISRITLLQLLIAYRTICLINCFKLPSHLHLLEAWLHTVRDNTLIKQTDISNVASNIDKGIVQQKHNAQKIWKQAAN